MCHFCDSKASGTPLLPTSPALPPQAAFLCLAQLVCFPECIVHSCFWVFHMLILQIVSFLPIKTLLDLSFLPSKKYFRKMPLLNVLISSYTDLFPCFYLTIYLVFVYQPLSFRRHYAELCGHMHFE